MKKPSDRRIQWLFRALGDVTFLPLYLSRSQCEVDWRARFKDTFFRLAPDSEHQASAREGAWRLISAQQGYGQGPAAFMRAVLLALDTLDKAEVYDRARVWASRELFEPPPPEPPRPADLPLPRGYHELHAHLRGSVPFEDLWHGWMMYDRRRVPLRKEWAQVGRWRKTWMEVVEYAEKTMRRLGRARVPKLSELALELRQMRNSADACRYLAVFLCMRRRFIHQRGQSGLAPFVKSFERSSNVQKAMEMKLLVRRICQRFEEEGAVGLELRPTLDRTPTELVRKLREIVLGYFEYLQMRMLAGKTGGPLVLGLVLRLYKQEGLTDKKAPAYTDWKAQQEIWIQQIDGLLEVLRRDPTLRAFVVGIDAAGQERGCHPYALTQAFQRVRALNVRLGAASVRPGAGIPLSALQDGLAQHSADWLYEHPEKWASAAYHRLGITCHAGEDFVDPLTGLRHIWETLDALKLGQGDRMGHALAAGLDESAVLELFQRRSGTPSAFGTSHQSLAYEVETLGDRRFRLSKPCSDHLLDLAFVEREGPKVLRPLARALLAAALPGLAGIPAQPAVLHNPPLHLLPTPVAQLPYARYKDPGNVPPEARTWIEVDKDYLTLIEQMRKVVVARLARRGVVIESCPTSNVVVANLTRPPLLTLHNDLKGRVVMATDDPGIFDSFPQTEWKWLQQLATPDARLAQCIHLTEEASFVWAGSS